MRGVGKCRGVSLRARVWAFGILLHVPLLGARPEQQAGVPRRSWRGTAPAGSSCSLLGGGAAFVPPVPRLPRRQLLRVPSSTSSDRVPPSPPCPATPTVVMWSAAPTHASVLRSDLPRVWLAATPKGSVPLSTAYPLKGGGACVQQDV